MPTNRRHSARRGTLSTEAVAWLATEDAATFFRDPDAYLAGYENCFQTPVQRLPGVPPWWSPLPDVWRRYLERAPLPPGDRAPIEAAAREFLTALHDEFTQENAE
jgi:hypothetical protein